MRNEGSDGVRPVLGGQGRRFVHGRFAGIGVSLIVSESPPSLVIVLDAVAGR